MASGLLSLWHSSENLYNMKREPKDINVLIACEESQTVCKAFRERGFNAYSNDIQSPSGGHPEWHVQMDCFEAIKLKKWDLMIGHPPCTHLAVSGARWFTEGKKPISLQDEGAEFFMALVNADIPHIAVENPVCVMSSRYRKPDQIIQPWQFGESFSKKTCLWVKNLPLLNHTNVVEQGERVVFESGRSIPKWYADAWGKSKEERSRIRSKFSEGIANAMAEQWGDYVVNELNRY